MNGRMRTAVLAISVLVLAGCAEADPEQTGETNTTTTTTAPETATTPSPTDTATETATETTTAPEAEGDPAGTRCPKVVMTAAEQPAEVYIREGTIPCDDATGAMQDYFLKLQDGQASGQGGGGPVEVRDWTCASGPSTEPWSTCENEEGAEVEAVPM